MAIAGSGGWIPSCAVCVRNGQLRTVGYTQNKPREIIEYDMDEALRRVLAGELVQIDMRTDYQKLLNRLEAVSVRR